MITELDPTDFSFVVKRRGSSSRPWRWEIYRAGKSDPQERSAVLFESMAQAAKEGAGRFQIELDASPTWSHGTNFECPLWVRSGLMQCSSVCPPRAKLAELGATELEIGAVRGHTTSKEIARYTRAARQKILAQRAMAKLSAGQNGNKVSHSGVAMRGGGTQTGRK